MYKCQHCNATFSNFYSLRSHENGNRVDGTPVCQLAGKKPVRERQDEGDVNGSSASVGADAVITNPFDLYTTYVDGIKTTGSILGPHNLFPALDCHPCRATRVPLITARWWWPLATTVDGF